MVDEFGGPETLVFRDTSVPECEADCALIKIEYAGVNYMDVYMRNGAYAKSHTYKTPLPMVIGMEGAGVVVKVGANVSNVQAGDRVAYCLSRGSYAEYAAVPAWRLVKIPAAVETAHAASAMLQGMTAHYLTHSIFQLKKGDSCLIHAGSGGVGQLAIQMAKAIGATVITTVGTAEKAKLAVANGADHVILYKEVDFREEVMKITNNQGVDVVYDSVGKDTIERSITSIRRRGLCVMFGASSGQVPCITPLSLAEAGSVYFTRPHLADYIPTAADINERATMIFDYMMSGKLRVPIHKIFELREGKEAHLMLESRGTMGKLLLKV
jgi:NADPH2:quinone reductase